MWDCHELKNKFKLKWLDEVQVCIHWLIFSIFLFLSAWRFSQVCGEILIFFKKSIKDEINHDIPGIYKLKDFDENSSIFRWKIENVSELNEKVESEVVEVAGHPWKLLVYLLGSQSTFFSTYLVCEGSKFKKKKKIKKQKMQKNLKKMKLDLLNSKLYY